MITITYTSSGLDISVRPTATTYLPTGPWPQKDEGYPYDARDKLETPMERWAAETQTAMLEKIIDEPSVYKWLDLASTEYEFLNPIITRAGDLVFEVCTTRKDIRINTTLCALI